MKIAILSSHTPSLFWFRLDMMQAFKIAGHDVIAIANEPESIWSEKFNYYGIRYKQIDIERNGTNPTHDLKTFAQIKQILKEEKPEKIFTYHAKTVIYGGIAARQLGIKEVYPLIAGIGSVFLSTNFKNKVIRQILFAEYRFALKKSTYVFFQNTDDSFLFTDKKIVPKEKIIIINGSGVNIENFTPTPVPENPAFLFIGRLIRDKGIKEYLDACRIVKSKNKNIKCLLVGPYDTNPSAIKPYELKSYIDDGIIEYFGEQTDVRPFLNQCSVYVLPSYHEGIPKTVLEAMACGRAIITTDAPGCKETVKDGENGYIVPIKNVEILANKMLYLIDNPQLIKKMGCLGREIAINKFDVKIINSKIMEIMKV